jgi:hypothetical protein
MMNIDKNVSKVRRTVMNFLKEIITKIMHRASKGSKSLVKYMKRIYTLRCRAVT